MTRVLLITTGGTPQLVTETVYALLNPSEGAPWIPDRIILATTSEGEALYLLGKNEFKTALPLMGGDGRLMALYRDLGREAEHVEPEILVAALASGAKIKDVRSPQEVEAYAQMLLGTVLGLTANDDVELHLSIAGGRKTMSFIAGQIMTMCGRARDIMSHCLIEPDTFENSPNFWWPGNDGKIDTADVQISLHHVPFIRLNQHINVRDIFREKEPNYSVAVERTNKLPETLRLVVDFRDRSISIGSDSLILPSKLFGLFTIIVLAKKWSIVVSNRSFDDPDNRLRFSYAASQALDTLAAIEARSKEMDDVRFEFDRAYSVTFGVISSNTSKLRSSIKAEFSRNDADRIFQAKYGVGVWTNFAADEIDMILPDGFDLSLFEKMDPNFMIGFR